MLSEALSLLTPVHIGANVWIGDRQIHQVLSVQITQRHAAHNLLKLRFYQDQAQPEGSLSFDGAEKLLGQVAEIILYDRNGGEKDLKNLFVVTKVSFEHDALNEGILNLEGQSPTGLLDAGPNYESFYRQNLAAIAKTVSKPIESVKATIQAKPTITDPFSFICRYGESSWNFLKRLSAETGQWLYFNGKALIFGEPESSQSRDLVYGQNCSRLSMQMQTKPVTAGYFDYEPSANENLNQNGNSDTQINYTDRGHAFSKSKAVFGSDSYRYPNSLPANSNTLAQIGKTQAVMQSADMYTITGESTLQELRVGMIANLKMARFGNEVSHTPIRIISITHMLDATGQYSNHFEAINAQSPAPPQINYDHPHTSAIPAEVIRNDDESGQGRVQVKFLGWKQTHSPQQTDWIRILTPDAGSSDSINKNRGYVFIPEPGDQVMVAFEHNNPDRPYVQGSLFHGGNGAGGLEDNHLKSIQTRSGNKILMNDAEGSIRVEDPSGNIVFLDGKGNIEVNAPKNIIIKAGEDISITAARNIKIDAGKDMDVIVADNKTVNIGKDFSHFCDNQTMVTSKNKTESIGDSLVQMSGDADVKTLKGDMIMRGAGLTVLQGGKDVKVSKG